MPQESDCGCGKLTRREFTTAAAVLATLPFATALPAHAETAPGICADIRDACMRNNCDPEPNPIRASLCRLQCSAEYHLCEIQRMLGRLGDAMQQAIKWLQDHPGVVIGTIIVIVGITFIVATGGAGAPIIIFA